MSKHLVPCADCCGTGRVWDRSEGYERPCFVCDGTGVEERDDTDEA